MTPLLIIHALLALLDRSSQIKMPNITDADKQAKAARKMLEDLLSVRAATRQLAENQGFTAEQQARVLKLCLLLLAGRMKLKKMQQRSAYLSGSSFGLRIDGWFLKRQSYPRHTTSSVAKGRRDGNLREAFELTSPVDGLKPVKSVSGLPQLVFATLKVADTLFQHVQAGIAGGNPFRVLWDIKSYLHHDLDRRRGALEGDEQRTLIIAKGSPMHMSQQELAEIVLEFWSMRFDTTKPLKQNGMPTPKTIYQSTRGTSNAVDGNHTLLVDMGKASNDCGNSDYVPNMTLVFVRSDLHDTRALCFSDYCTKVCA